MNIIIYPKSRKKIYHVHYANRWYLVVFVLASIAISAVLVTTGYWVGRAERHRPLIEEWKKDIVAHQDTIETIKRESQAHIDALTQKVGILQAHINRIDALGNRLVEMADLDAEEFNFKHAPSVGGPEDLGESNSSNNDKMLDEAIQKLNAELENCEVQLDILNELLLTKNLQAQTFPQGAPVIHGWISSHYGKRTSPFTGKSELHAGIDFAGKAGTDVIAVAGGLVTIAGKHHGYGNLVEIDHSNGYITRYGHNESVLVEPGQAVKKGEVVAKMGSTGRATGSHVHFEVIKDRKRINPQKFIQ